VIRIIRDHNRLNGLRFCAFEFGAIALLCVGFAALFASRGSLLFGLVGLGIALNCLPVIVLAIRSIRAGERDIGLRAMLRSDVRGQAQRDVTDDAAGHVDPDRGDHPAVRRPGRSGHRLATSIAALSGEIPRYEWTPATVTIDASPSERDPQ